MAEYSVGDEPGHAADGVVGDVVVPHHVEWVGSGFAVRPDAEDPGVVRNVGAGLVAAHVFRFIERNELGLPVDGSGRGPGRWGDRRLCCGRYGSRSWPGNGSFLRFRCVCHFWRAGYGRGCRVGRRWNSCWGR